MNISIIGLGWLGLELGYCLTKNNFKVFGSTTSDEKIKSLSNTKINSQKLIVDKKGNIDFSSPEIFSSEKIIITLPFKRSFIPANIYELQIKSIVEKIKEYSTEKTQVIFTSSTSIYPKNYEIVNEFTPLEELNTRQQVLLNVENLIKNQFSNFIILRLGGLFGGSRKIGMFMNNKQTLENANSPVNLIHRKDVINIIELIIQKNIQSELFNCVCNHHPSKEELYDYHAKLLNKQPPKFIENKIKTKKVEAKNLKQILNYKFLCHNLFSKYD